MGSLRLGRILGFPIEIRTSFLLLLLLAFVFFGGLAGVLLLLVTFASVLIHELGHAVVARRLGVPILGIDLHFFGGAAKMAAMPDTPRDEILIAGAGPAVSLALALFGGTLHWVTGVPVFGYFGIVNLILAVFNLLPALPMDGGRIFRAALATRMGRLRATEVAVKVARVVAVGLGVWALLAGHLFLAALAVMLWLMAGAELRAARLWCFVNGERPDQPSSLDPGVELLDRDGRTIRGRPPAFSVEEHRGPGGRRWILRAPDGRVVLATERFIRW